MRGQWHDAVGDVAVAMAQASDGHFVRNLSEDDVVQLARIAVNVAWGPKYLERFREAENLFNGLLRSGALDNVTVGDVRCAEIIGRLGRTRDGE